MKSGFLRIGVLFLAGLLLTLVGVIWLASSNWGLQLAAKAITHFGQGQIIVKSVRGSLFGPLHVGELVITSETKQFMLTGLELDWTPRQLFQNNLVISRLDANELFVRQIKPSPEPLTFPETLRVPVSLSVNAIHLARLTFEKNLATFTLTHLSASLQKVAGDYQLTLSQLDSPWGSAKGRLTLADTHPFALNAKLSAQRDEHYALQANAQGTLGSFDVNALASEPVAFELKSRFTPFQPVQIQFVDLTAHGINPARLHAGLPSGDLSAQGHFRINAEQTLQGDVHVQNAAAGPLDRNRIPITAFQGKLDGKMDDLTFHDLMIDLKSGGLLRGNGSLKKGQLSLILNTSNLDPHAIHSRLRSMRLAGNIDLGASESEQSLKMRLASQRYHLAGDVTRRGDDVHISSAHLSADSSKLDLSGLVTLTGQRTFNLNGQLDHFNPAALGDYPSANLNARLEASGTLSPVAGKVQFNLASSRYRNQPVAGHGQLDLTPSRIRHSDIHLVAGNNTLNIQGSFGTAGDQLRWNLDGNNLSILDPRFSGRVNATGTLEGTYINPSGMLNIDARGLRWSTVYVAERLLVKGNLAHGVRSEERRVGKECRRLCRSRWSPYH
jgi:translocation and assembly module TamB